MDREKLRELAADIAQGAAGAAEQANFYSLLAKADRESRQEVAQLFDMAALLSLNAAKAPPSGLKAKVMAEARATSGLSFVRAEESSGWQKLPVPGASVKVLALDHATGYATVMGKLEAGSRYPAHRHASSEQIYMVSGDLVVGDVTLKAGDFHHAAAGSEHGENHSETGCVIIAILSQADLMAQLELASA